MSDDVRFRDDMGVTLIDSSASDEFVVRAARVSTGLDKRPVDPAIAPNLINYLLRNRHGTPFEHNSFTFRVECPIFVAREFMRHRMMSFNEESGRYKELAPVFWIPASSRPLVQTGKPGHYEMRPGTMTQWENTRRELRLAANSSFVAYKRMLEDGVAREVARGALPVSIYTSFYATCNARSLMNFLSLRVDDPDAMFPSKPQYEIQQVAEQMEVYFAAKMPVTYRAFVEARRVAP